MNQSSSSPDELYQQGLRHLRRGEWREAIAALSAVKDSGVTIAGLDQLLADAQIKLQFETIERPAALMPPRRTLRMVLTALLILALLGVSAYGVSYLLSSKPVVAEAQPTATAAPPPTVTATVQPTPPPTATPEPTPTDAPLLPATLVVTPADGETFVNTPKNIEVIVDASGSMLAEVPGTGKQRWQIAQEALKTLVGSGTIAEDSYVAVRTYGRQRGNDCSDLELAQPPARFDATGLNGVIDGIKPAVGGMTPLGASLRAAVTDLQAAEGSTVVILVTDGLESCNGDPVAEAAGFVQGATQRSVHVIGFALDNPEASAKLREIATSGKGLYFDAADSAQLAEALRQTIVLRYQVLAADGSEVLSGTIGDGGPVELAAGAYRLRINANPPIEKDLIVPSGASVSVRIRQGYGGLVADIDAAKP